MNQGPPATVAITEQDGQTTLAFAGNLDAVGTGRLWRRVHDLLRAVGGRGLTLDCSNVALIDTAGATFLIDIEHQHQSKVEITGLAPRSAALLDRVRPAAEIAPRPASPPPLRLRDIGRGALRAAALGVAFGGEAAVALVSLPRRRRMLRLQDLLLYADQAGVRSLPLVVLLGFLMGMILAFQSLVPMRRFGAELYVVNLVAISLLRELGPLIAAVILAGRTGSAFAAEIGTMKVNEEVSALVTMGLDPMTMLVLPRLVAVTLVMPAMTLVLDVAGLLGMGVVMMSSGFPAVTITHQTAQAAQLSDLFQGLFKALCFGAVVAAIGCREGLGTGVGPRAVGQAATGAVVGGIVAVVLLDGLFAVLIVRLGW